MLWVCGPRRPPPPLSPIALPCRAPLYPPRPRHPGPLCVTGLCSRMRLPPPQPVVSAPLLPPPSCAAVHVLRQRLAAVWGCEPRVNWERTSGTRNTVCVGGALYRMQRASPYCSGPPIELTPLRTSPPPLPPLAPSYLSARLSPSFPPSGWRRSPCLSTVALPLVGWRRGRSLVWTLGPPTCTPRCRQRGMAAAIVHFTAGKGFSFGVMRVIS